MEKATARLQSNTLNAVFNSVTFSSIDVTWSQTAGIACVNTDSVVWHIRCEEEDITNGSCN